MALPIILKGLFGREIGLGPDGELIVNQQDQGKATKSQALVEHVAIVTITSAQILALFSTPITLLAAPGAGRAWIPTRIVMTKEAGTAYTVGTATDLLVYYTGLTGENIMIQHDTDFMDQTTEESRVLYGCSHSTAGADINVVANTAVLIRSGTANMTGGTGNLIVKIWADQIDMPIAA